MALLDRLVQRLGYTKSARTRAVAIPEFELRTGHDRPEDFEDYAVAYAQVVWVHACASIIASAVAGLPLTVRRNGRAQPDSTLQRLLDAPNRHTTGYDLWEQTVTSLELAGNAYWEIERDPTGRPIAIYSLRPDLVRIVPDVQEYVRGYLYEVNGQSVSLTPDEVIHFRYFNPLDEYYGLGPLAAARHGVIADSYAVAYNTNFFRNGARPHGVLETERSLSDDSLRRLRAQWEQAHRGSGRAHRIAILEEGLAYKPLSLTPQDMEFVAQRRISREEICAAFKVPPAVVGLFEYANYANAQQQERFFWGHTIVPKTRKLEHRIAVALRDQFRTVLGGPGWDVRFDLSGVTALQADRMQQARVSALLVGSGLQTINERRAADALPPVPWGDVWHRLGAARAANERTTA